MPKVRTVDSHTHILTEEAMRLLTKESPKVAPVLKGLGTAKATLEIGGHVVQDPMPTEIWDLGMRLRDMDANNVDVQVLSPTVFTFFYHQEPKLALACAAIQNEEIATVVKRQPDRFIGLGSVPLQAPEQAASELRRAMTKLGLRGAMIGSNVMGKNLDDPGFEPLWAAAEELGAFMFIHPVEVAGANRLTSYYLRNLIGNPLDTTIAAASLLFGGVMDRHPKLKVCLAHGGGFMPYQAGRWRHGWSVRPEPKKNMPREPENIIGRFFYDTILHADASLEFLIAQAGHDRVLLGSDYPYDMAMPDCVAHVRALPISDVDKAVILGGRAEELLVGKV